MDYFHLNQTGDDIRAVSNLGLAHVGDGVYELMVRSWLCVHGKATNRGLHRATVGYVSAPAQARAARRLLPLLTQEEQAVFRRGRNTPPPTCSKTAPRQGYHAATGREARLGYLWLKGETERLNELFAAIMED
ncbi:MAG: ribonuclease III [Oscillospiraceae bacterium]|nr:ribonuclease III [Oscillospiraceae bacterium]